MKKILCITLCIILSLSLLTGCLSSVGGYEDIKGVKNGDVIDGNTRFAFEMFRLLNSEDNDSNIFISPLSISMALTMTLNGAAGSTEEVMKQALFYSGSQRDSINAGSKYLKDRLTSLDKKVTLNIANSIWIKEGYPIKQAFKDINSQMFDAEVKNLDFSKSDSVNVINGWIDKATKGLIPTMLEPPIPANVVMYLINAIYFKGEWTIPFDPKSTYDRQFNAIDGTKPVKPMMAKTGEVDFYKTDSFQAIRLPYGSGKVSMYCILPDETSDIDRLVDEMNIEVWTALREGMVKRDEAFVQIPKFKMEYGIKELNSSLTALGMGEAFSDNANFSDMSDNNLAISRVLHKAVIEVNEEGSKAAGVTVVEMRETAMPDRVYFTADRPFLFVIADNEDGSILFMGKMIK